MLSVSYAIQLMQKYIRRLCAYIYYFAVLHSISMVTGSLSLSVGCAELSNNSSAVPRRYGKSFCRAIASDHFNPFGWKTTFEFITFFLFFKLEIEMRHHSLLDGGHFVSAP